LIAFYSSLFEAKEKPKLLAKLVSTSLIINIVVNYILIKYLLQFGQEYAILGAALATVLSRLFYLGFLIIKTKQVEKIKTKFSVFIKPIIASIVMAIFLISFPKMFDMNWILGMVEVAIGILIYLFVLYAIKGFEKEDVKIFKAIFTNKILYSIKNKKL
jgi:Na+-driven multidrug efflux pump